MPQRVGDVMTVKRILVPTDFSPDADAALAFALGLAQRFGASVHLLHVVENPVAADERSSRTYAPELAALQVTLVRYAEEHMRRAIRQLAAARSRLQQDVRIGQPAPTILDVAISDGVDLIVMGTAGHTGAARVLLGSIAERVIRTAPCPVLTLRADERHVPSKERNEAADRVPA
jgi:nucleotide-binding universal stress UspA family protein